MPLVKYVVGAKLGGEVKMAHIIVNKKEDKLTIKEWDGRLQNEVVRGLDRKFVKLILKVAYNSPNSTVEYV